jgi:tRNA modification GTPase
MSQASYTDLAPIAAIATAQGPAALSVIRTSGKNTIELLSGVFSRPRALRAAPGNTALYGWIVWREESCAALSPDSPARSGEVRRIDEVLVNIYRAPKSYTGEDGADIICHGGTAAPQAVLAALLRAGFREALRGEFTFRAFANGKLTLDRAESVLEMVDARTDKARENAVSRLSGALAAELDSIKRNLVIALAAVELALDYSELDGVADAPEGIPERERINDALSRLENVSRAYQSQRLYQEGALVAIAGKPNAGKSSVFNLLLKEERAIVTPVPGTTRDYIEATLDADGIPIRLVDTAGLHDSADLIEVEGIRRSRLVIEEADLVLHVKDSTAYETPHDSCVPGQDGIFRSKPVITVWNKIDLLPANGGWTTAGENAVPFSAKTGAGLADLLRAITGALAVEQPSEHGVAPGTERQRHLIDRAAAAVTEAIALADGAETGGESAALDLAAPALREAVNALGEISGEVTHEDILSTMFSRFCVGK